MSIRKKKKVFVAMSGGVDSSVAALLLKTQGYEVIGVFIHCYNVDGCSEKDVEDARQVASKLKIPFYVFDFEEEYKKRVVNYMIESYAQGMTPNPDVMCNQQIKFGLFLEKALSLGADYIATGHYALLKKDSEEFTLWQSKDLNKDQTYFLWTLNQKQLVHCLFPIGNYLKSEVRKIAKENNLPTAEKKDSQGICFLGSVDLFDFLSQYLPIKKGEVISTNGQKIGFHQGAWFYTIGQRHIGVAAGSPIYVAEKDLQRNVLVVAPNEDPLLYRQEIKLGEVNFVNSFDQVLEKIEVYARVRYRQPLFKGILIKENQNSWRLIFEKPVKFVAPGQSAVFYNDQGRLIGGGIIK